MPYDYNVLHRLVLVILSILIVTPSIVATGKNGFVGCLFQSGLCQTGQEWCHDDGIFGRCLPLNSDLSQDALSSVLHRSEMGDVELAALEAALTQLQSSGHRWTDAATQCVLQCLVNYFRTGDSGNPNICSTLYEKEGGDKQQSAYVNEDANGNEDNIIDDFQFARGNGYFPSDGSSLSGPNSNPLQAPVYLSSKDLASLMGIAEIDRYTVGKQEPEDFLSLLDILDEPTEYEQRKNESPSEIPNSHAAENKEGPISAENLKSEDATVHYLPAEKHLARRLQEILHSVKELNGRSSAAYNSAELPSRDRLSGLESEEDDLDMILPGNVYANSKFERQERLDVKKPGPWFSVNNFAFQNDEDESDFRPDDQDTPSSRDLSSGDVWISPTDIENAFDDLNSQTDLEKDPVLGTFGNLPNYRDFRKYDHRFLTAEERPAVQRYSQMMNVALDEEARENDELNSEVASQESPNRSVTPSDKTESPGKSEADLRSTKLQTKKDLQPPSLTRSGRDIVEAKYAFITVKGEFQTWDQGARLVNILSDLLQVPPETFTDVGVHGNQVTFLVMPNRKGLNPSSVAAQADSMRDQIGRISGFEVDATGIGDQTRVSRILYWGQENQQMLLTAGLCLLAAAVLVAAVIVFLLRNRYVARQKLKDLTQSADTEATRDYQDLCRARMAAKSNSTETAPGATSKGPHALLSRDSESSRSSTSSWCEEPVLTNMDISTGHMVLSYMEDHLRNKDRLDQEWQALCAYEAEPSTSVVTGSNSENAMKNRYPDVLPYDHCRVVLNTMASATGSDYINASSITDHDPRHPAYIAAQAPVADSVSDFWQMVWEQGSVVLVLLTRLNENGQSLCYNYWPEEGSQLYHIYEVHLVSEHIWCDDYLVRSFYLKNIRTGETRTVTQFHFQSWPDNGVPTSTKALLEFRRKVNKSYRGRSCPIVVHCSDGAGRTGTYCLIDMVLHRMAKGAREIDIAATLEHLRDQRSLAVRTKQQFEFVLTAVAEEVHAILRALPQ